MTKTLSFATMHFSIVVVGGAVALVEPAVDTVGCP